MDQPRILKLDKTKFEVVDSFEEAATKHSQYWLSKSPIERLAACELLQQMNYGYDPLTARLPRSFEISERGEVRYSVIGGMAVNVHGYH
jgi:hypothetical protein